MYLSAQHMVSEGFAVEITGVVIYAFVPHFWRHEKTKGRHEHCLDSLSNPEGSPERSLESRSGTVVYISCSYCRCHPPFDGHHLGNDGHKY